MANGDSDLSELFDVIYACGDTDVISPIRPYAQENV